MPARLAHFRPLKKRGEGGFQAPIRLPSENHQGVLFTLRGSDRTAQGHSNEPLHVVGHQKLRLQAQLNRFRPGWGGTEGGGGQLFLAPVDLAFGLTGMRASKEANGPSGAPKCTWGGLVSAI